MDIFFSKTPHNVFFDKEEKEINNALWINDSDYFK